MPTEAATACRSAWPAPFLRAPTDHSPLLFALLPRSPTTTWPDLHGRRLGALGSIRLAASGRSLYLAALATDYRLLRTFRNLTAAWRALHKTASGTLDLVWPAAQIVAFHLATFDTDLSAPGAGLPRFAACYFALLAAIHPQHCSRQGHRQHHHQTSLACLHNCFLSNNLQAPNRSRRTLLFLTILCRPIRQIKVPSATFGDILSIIPNAVRAKKLVLLEF